MLAGLPDASRAAALVEGAAGQPAGGVLDLAGGDPPVLGLLAGAVVPAAPATALLPDAAGAGALIEGAVEIGAAGVAARGASGAAVVVVPGRPGGVVPLPGAAGAEADVANAAGGGAGDDAAGAARLRVEPGDVGVREADAAGGGEHGVVGRRGRAPAAAAQHHRAQGEHLDGRHEDGR